MARRTDQPAGYRPDRSGLVVRVAVIAALGAAAVAGAVAFINTPVAPLGAKAEQAPPPQYAAAQTPAPAVSEDGAPAEEAAPAALSAPAAPRTSAPEIPSDPPAPIAPPGNTPPIVAPPVVAPPSAGPAPLESNPSP